MAKSPTNFNIYEVLQPLKCSLTSQDENVAVLIDINDSDKNEDLSGSDLDSIKKSEFDLVDLYQNIYVTPQHVKKLKDMNVEKDSQKTQGEIKKGSKYVNGLKPLGIDDINELLKGVDEDETDSLNSSYMSNENILHEYEIPKLLKVPPLHYFDSKDDIQNSANSIENTPEQLTEDTTDYHKYVFEKPNGLIENKRVELTLSQTNYTSNIQLTNSTDYLKDIKKVARELIAKKTTESPLHNINGGNNNSKLSLGKLPKVENLEILQTAKLDKKLYAKQRQTKTEREKVLYTKGPDLYEKSVVLPQIVKRLAIRKQELDEVATRRLILDSGKQSPESSCQCAPKMALNSKNTKDTLKESPKIAYKEIHTVSANNKGISTKVDSLESIKINPIVAMEDCNRERLIANRTRSAFERFVQTGSYY